MTSKYSRLRLKKRTSINSISVFHKEKEMADFRKWLFAFAVLALMLGASSAYAQIPGGSGSVICNLNPANPTIVSVENITALVGDYVLVCSGGQPTQTGNPIPQDNVTLTLNQNITSRLLTGGYIDVLLTIDEPYPTTPNPGPGSGLVAPPQVVGSPTGQRVCYSSTAGPASSPANCNVIPGTWNPGTFLFSGNPYDPSGPNGAQAYNVFVAHATSNLGQVTWLGVPIDAPGTAGSRIIRMTNIRANACNAGLSGGLVPTQINGFVSFNGGQNVVVNQSQQVLAYVQQGLLVSSTHSTLVQCTDVNTFGAGTNFTGQGDVGASTFTVTLKEGYAASFKRKTAAFTAISDVNDTNNTASLPQNVVGYNYNSESGFEPTAGLGNATQGDRFLIVFNNVNTGAALWVPQYVPLTVNGDGKTPGAPSPGNGGAIGAVWSGGWLQLVGSSSDLSGNPTALAPSSTATFNPSPLSGWVGPTGAPFLNAVVLSGTGNTLTAVYEVANADPFAQESAIVNVGVAYVSNTANNLPAPGQSTVTASFAPLSTVGTWSATDPIPRWCNKSSASNSFLINVCTCDLLFPFVTNIGGFDTGIAIANTTMDPYGTTPQNGNITLYFYGSLPGTPAPAPITNQTTTATVNAGTELLFTLSSGGDHGVQAEVGFTGYIIAVANFQYCHGFAFISDMGAQKLAEGYLAIQLDGYAFGLNRTGIIGEVQGH
jgi:hypothetical protein